MPGRLRGGSHLRTVLRWSGPSLLLLATIALRTLGDRWWLLLPLLYGPRWILSPLLLTPLLAIRKGGGRATLLALALGVMATASLIDFRTGWRTMLPSGDDGAPLRVITWNAQGGGDDLSASALRLSQMRPDIIVVAECSLKFEQVLKSLLDMRLYRSSGLCLVTSLPEIEWAPRPPQDFWRAGGSGAIARLTLDVGGSELVLGAVHLETPRDALDELELIPIGPFREATLVNQEMRDVESAAARTWIAPPHDELRPVVVAGDFNLPVESAIYRRWWGDFDNAFSRVGTGLGWTKRTRLFGVRIDHVLTGNGVAIEHAELGAAMGSDHRPLIVDLRVRQADPATR